MYPSITLLAATLAVTSAKVIQIDVGKSGFTFTPDSVQAAAGDTLEFHFSSSIHTVVQGDFNTPCAQGTKKATGFNSGPFKNTANVFQVPVTSTDPLWFYCGTPTHCQGGMVGAVNAPDTGNTLDAYRTAAADTSSSESGPTVQGGSIVPAGTVPSSGSGGSSVSSSSTAPASSSEAPSSSAAPTESAAPTVTTTSGSITVAPTSTSVPSSKTSSVATSATVVPTNGGSVLDGKAALIGVIVAGLGFLVMLV